MTDYSKKRTTIFQKIVVLKQKQKEKLQKIKKQMKQLERQNLSISGFTKLTKKSINLIQKQRRENVTQLNTYFKKVEIYNKELTILEKKYLSLIQN
jgi:hypothetical protein